MFGAAAFCIACTLSSFIAPAVTRPHPRFVAKVAGLGVVGRAQLPAQRRPAHAKLPVWAHALHHAAAGGPYVFSPQSFGADPTGRNDSSPAFDALLAAAWAVAGSRPGAVLTNGPDLGGVVLDLQGGIYTLSRPLRFPSAGGGHLAMRDGTLRAGPSFPQGGGIGGGGGGGGGGDGDGDGEEELALLMLTAANGTSTDDGACCWYELIYFSNLVLDGSRRTGCARVHTATRVLFDEVFFLGYGGSYGGSSPTGLYYGEPSHQLLLTRSFFGVTDWRGSASNRSLCEQWSHAVGAVGLHLDGPDNHVEDSVFFCSGIGIKLTSGANYFAGVHAFTGAAEESRYPLGALYVPAKLGSNGREMVGQHGNRFDHCYWDYAMVRIENPLQIEFTNNYAIGLPGRYADRPAPYFQLVAVSPPAGGAFVNNVSISGLRITGTFFQQSGAAHQAHSGLVAFGLNETGGTFDRDKIVNTRLSGNDFQGVQGKATRVRASRSSTNGSFAFDLCEEGLLFAPTAQRPADELFAHMQYSVRHHVATAPAAVSVDNCTVRISVNTSAAAIVYLDVDQSHQSFTL